jgi:hypothetical protein
MDHSHCALMRTSLQRTSVDAHGAWLINMGSQFFMPLHNQLEVHANCPSLCLFCHTWHGNTEECNKRARKGISTRCGYHCLSVGVGIATGVTHMSCTVHVPPSKTSCMPPQLS